MKEARDKIVALIGERFDVGVDAVTETAIEDILNDLLGDDWSQGFDVGYEKGSDAGWDLCYAEYNPYVDGH